MAVLAATVAAEVSCLLIFSVAAAKSKAHNNQTILSAVQA